MNDQRPLVSIGLPVFNGARYIGQALDALLNQTHSHLELIISDNASTDETTVICGEYAAKDPRIRYFRNERNLGAAPNFNRTFDLSSGEYFKWMAYDDVVAPDYLSKCVEVLDREPGVVLCFSRARIIDESGHLLGERSYEADTAALEPHVRFRNLALCPVNTALPVFGVMRASVVRRTRLIESYPSSDVVLLATLALHGAFYEIPEALFSWRQHPEQSTKGALSVERDRVLWFNTGLQGRITLPKWQLLCGYLRGIGDAPVSRRERMLCYGQMVRWGLVPAHFRAMGKDVLLGIVRLVRRRAR